MSAGQDMKTLARTRLDTVRTRPELAMPFRPSQDVLNKDNDKVGPPLAHWYKPWVARGNTAGSPGTERTRGPAFRAYGSTGKGGSVRQT
jgi:hypothetical protein